MEKAEPIRLARRQKPVVSLVWMRIQSFGDEALFKNVACRSVIDLQTIAKLTELHWRDGFRCG